MPSTEAVLAGALTPAYRLAEPVHCRRLRGGFNEHYRLSTAEGDWHLRLYLEGKYYLSGEADIVFELDLLDHLAGAGLPVAAPVRRRDGELLTRLVIDGRERRCALFALAPGEPPSEPPELDVSRAIGAAVAGIHVEADRVAGQLRGGRYHLDGRYLLHEPLRLIRRALGADTSVVDERKELWAGLAAALDDLERDSPRYGIIHADLHPGNLHIDGDRFTLFDFDHCAHGWRAYDLATCRLSLPDEAWAAFLDGYDGVRTLLPGEVDSVPLLARLRHLWDIGDMLAMEPVWGTTRISDTVPERLPAILDALES